MKTAIEDLFSTVKGRFHGDLLRSPDPEYAHAQGIWNAMAQRMPALIAGCADVADV